MGVLATIVDWGDVVDVLWTATAAGIAVTFAFSVALLGATRAVDLRRDGRMAGAGVYAALGALALAVVGAAVVFGIVAMTSK